MTHRQTFRYHTKPLYFMIYVGFFLIFMMIKAAASPLALWAQHNNGNHTEIDHSPWDQFLQKYVISGTDGINRVQYADVTPDDQLILDRYINDLAQQDITQLNRDEQEALWINLYNALTVRVVLRHYPVASIRDIDISPGLFADGPWGAVMITTHGEDLSLDDIEHRILRPLWHDPRLHYALNCASLGCPNLQPHAFSAATLSVVLDQAAKDYINHPRGVALRNGKLYLSSIYDWFASDFGDSDDAILRHLALYASPDLKAILANKDIGGYQYDWRLNDTRIAPVH